MQLQYNDMPLPLFQWFIQGHNATLKKVSYLGNFPAYIQNTTSDNYSELKNLMKETFINRKGDDHIQHQ